jgi:hypothetical protein
MILLIKQFSVVLLRPDNLWLAAEAKPWKPINKGHFTHETKGCDRCILRFIIGQKGQDLQVYFTLESEGLKAQRIIADEKIYINSYMAYYK